MALALLAVFSIGGAFAAAEVTSDSQFVYVRPERASFWRTATNNTVALNVVYPSGVNTASLAVRGHHYRTGFVPVPEGTFNVALPAANKPSEENVCELLLAFDNGTTNWVTIGVLDGVRTGGDGSTRCVLDASSRSWQRVVGSAVLPVPYGAASLTIDGQQVDTGLDGAQGWYQWAPQAFNQPHSLELAAETGVSNATLVPVGGGFVVIIR